MLDWVKKSLSLSIAELDDGAAVLSSQRVSSSFSSVHSFLFLSNPECVRRCGMGDYYVVLCES